MEWKGLINAALQQFFCLVQTFFRCLVDYANGRCRAFNSTMLKMYDEIFQEKCLKAELKTFYVPPPRRTENERLKCLLRKVNHCHRVFTALWQLCAFFVARILIPLDYITKLELLLIALHREGQILCRFYLCGMMNWAAELFLLHFNFPHLSRAVALKSPHREF